MQYDVISPAPREAWQDILTCAPRAMAFHTPEWLTVVTSSGPWDDASRLYVLEDGRRLVVPLVKRGHGRLTERASLPYGWGFGGVVTDGPVSQELLRLVVGDLASGPAIRTTLRPDPLLGGGLRSAVPPGAAVVARSAHVLDLAGGFSRVWSDRFTGSARTAVRKAERQGVQVECDTSGRLLPVFYRLYEASLLRWNPGAYARRRARRREPIRKYAAVVAEAAGMARIWVAWHDGQPAAAILTLSRGRVVNYWRGAMEESLAGPSRANYLLHRHAIEQACADGAEIYHMGETGGSTSLGQFKTRFGARAVDYPEVRLEAQALTRLSEGVDGARRHVATVIAHGRRTGSP
jgi:hypothetical protein